MINASKKTIYNGVVNGAFKAVPKSNFFSNGGIMKISKSFLFLWLIFFPVGHGISCNPEQIVSENWDSCEIIGLKNWIGVHLLEKDFGVLGTPLNPGYAEYYLVLNDTGSEILISNFKKILGPECSKNNEDYNLRFRILCQKKSNKERIKQKIYLTETGKIKIEDCFFQSKDPEWLYKTIKKIYFNEG